MTYCQSCRPLSGAVTAQSVAGKVIQVRLSIVPPPFGSGYLGDRAGPAPVRQLSIVPPPFGSGYVDDHAFTPDSGSCQSCRPLSGAVTGASIAQPPPRLPLSIVPPPFGSGYLDGASAVRMPQGACQSCRPLSGAVTTRAAPTGCCTPSCQSCRPLSGAVTSLPKAPSSARHRPVNRAAPFRERLPTRFSTLPQQEEPVNRAAPFRERLPAPV